MSRFGELSSESAQLCTYLWDFGNLVILYNNNVQINLCKTATTTILMINGSLMKVESIAECSTWSNLQNYWPALSDNWSWKPNFGPFESGRFYCNYIEKY